jgi:hypothetical protein
MSVEAIVGVPYFATSAGWVANRRPTLPTNSDRESLVLGAYIPDDSTTGLLPEWTPARLTPMGNGTSVTITGPGPYENILFWGTVNMKSPTLPVFRNCAFAGPNPLAGSAATGCIKCFGAGFYQWYAEDCLIDPGLWRDPTVTRPDGSAMLSWSAWNKAVAGHVNGVHGGRGTLLRCNVRNTGDNVQSTQRMNDAADPGFTWIEGSWLHGNLYYLAADAVASGFPSDGNHADNFQFHTGSHFTLIGNRIGGPRDASGYGIYDPDTNPSGVSYNTGDDAFNAGIMVSQGGATPPTSLELLQDIEMHHNFFEGGKYGINHPQSSTRPNDFATYSCHDNYFIRRADGKYVIRNAAFSSRYVNNRVVDVNGSGGFTVAELIPYTNG